jgi:hypothetical protein
MAKPIDTSRAPARGQGFLALAGVLLVLLLSISAWTQFLLAPGLAESLSHLFRRPPPISLSQAFLEYWQWIVGLTTVLLAAAILFQSRRKRIAAAVWFGALAVLAIDSLFAFGPNPGGLATLGLAASLWLAVEWWATRAA